MFHDAARKLSVLERNTLLMLARGMTHEEIAFKVKVPVASIFEAAWSGRAKLEGRGS